MSRDSGFFFYKNRLCDFIREFKIVYGAGMMALFHNPKVDSRTPTCERAGFLSQLKPSFGIFMWGIIMVNDKIRLQIKNLMDDSFYGNFDVN